MKSQYVACVRSCLVVWCCMASAARAQVIINEIHYDPVERTVNEEFVELYNAGAAEVDLSGWYFSSGLPYVFPDGTTLASGEYIVVAAEPAVIHRVFGEDLRVLGPVDGRLDNDGESLDLRDRTGFRQDVVTYKLGFPWPMPGGPSGHSIELVHPGFDNDLGGSWRLSTTTAAGGGGELVSAGARWSFFKGESEPSTPREAWRAIDFNDSAWDSGLASLGYGEGVVRTELDDMRGNYSTLYLRREFSIEEASAVGRTDPRRSVRRRIQRVDQRNARSG